MLDINMLDIRRYNMLDINMLDIRRYNMLDINMLDIRRYNMLDINMLDICRYNMLDINMSGQRSCCVHLSLNVSISALNCGCVVDGGNAMAAI